MAEPAAPAVAASLQHPVAGMATTPKSIGPLRLDSGGDPPSSGKMVSLADLHINTNTPGATPREPDLHVSCKAPPRPSYKTRPPPPAHRSNFLPLQGVDPMDPLLHHLVQDKTFSSAVQGSQLHAAAAAAVRVLRVRRQTLKKYY